MKAVLISIQPKWCELIANGRKTIEVRKTRPTMPTPFKCYIYCTKAKEFFSVGGGMYFANDQLYRLPNGEIKFGDSFELAGNWSGQYSEDNFYNGKVIGEFVCNEITVAECGSYSILPKSKTLVDELDLLDYADEKNIYGWHISDLVIYDKPKPLDEFRTLCKEYDKENPNCRGCEYYYYESNESVGFYDECTCDGLKHITRPPQSWCYARDRK